MPFILMNKRSNAFYKEPLPAKSQEVITLFDREAKAKQDRNINALGVSKLFIWLYYEGEKAPTEPLYYVKQSTEKRKTKKYWIVDDLKIVVSEYRKNEIAEKEPQHFEFIQINKK